MLKKLILAALVALPMFASAQTLKVGLVDINAVIQAMPETAEAQKKIEETAKSYDEEYRKLGEEMNRKVQEFQALKADEPQAIKDRKTRELEDFSQKIKQFETNAQNDLGKLQNDLMMPIVQKVKDAINSVGKEGGYSLIQNLDPQIIFFHASPAVDITNDVKAKLGIK